MADLTDKKNDLMIVLPDAKTMTKFVEWEGKLKTDEKANFSIAGGFIFSVPNPADNLKATRDAFIDLVDKNAETPTVIWRLNHNGPTPSMISMRVADPEVEEPA